MYEEFLREFRSGTSRRSLHLLHETGLLEYLLPNLWTTLNERSEIAWGRLDLVLGRIDKATLASEKELPASVLFLALMIGNIPAALIEKLSAEPKGEETLEYWTLEPLVHVDGNGETQSDSVERTLAKLSSRVEKAKRSSRSRTTPSRLANLIGEIYEGLTISRKDKERMEQLLYARFLLLTSGEEKTIADISRRSYAADLLLLLELTLPDGVMENVLEAMRKKVSSKKPRKSTTRPRSRRRSRRSKSRKESGGEE